MRNRENKNNSHVTQLDLLINMAQDEQDHVAPTAAIFVLQACTGFILFCQYYFKLPVNSSQSDFKHSFNNNQLPNMNQLTRTGFITLTGYKETNNQNKQSKNLNYPNNNKSLLYVLKLKLSMWMEQRKILVQHINR